TDTILVVGGTRDTFWLAVDNLNGATPVYLWLQDGTGNLNYLNNSSIVARRDTVAPTNAAVKPFAADTTFTTTFAVNWAPGTDALSGIQAWRVLSRIDTSAAWDTLAPFTNDTTMVFSGALPGHRYYFEAAAFDSAYNMEPLTGTAECSLFVSSPTIDTIPPAIIVTGPANGAIGVMVDAAVTIQFSEPIRASLFGYSVSPDPGGLTAGWSADSTLVTIGHAPFATATGYVVTVTSAQDTMGLPLAGVNSFGFTTADTSLPTIVSTFPANGATAVAIDAPLSFTFSEAMDRSSFAYSVAPDPGGMGAAWTADSLTVTISHAAFGYLTTYAVTVDTARDAAGNPLSGPNGFSFTTGAAPDTVRPSIAAASPADGQTGVALGTPVVVSFSEPVDTASLRFACVPNPVGWAVSWSDTGRTATLTHGGFAPNTVYTFSVDSVADLSGNPLDTAAAPNRPWSFTTVAGPITLSTPWSGGAWRLFSVPMAPQDTTALGLLGDDLGTYSD
ncbi:hypothetical protein EG831_09175, partial [bacterium]|nr:hypothetical protein [bacterium]